MNKAQAHCWRTLARIPEKQFEEYCEKAREQEDRLSVSAALRMAAHMCVRCCLFWAVLGLVGPDFVLGSVKLQELYRGAVVHDERHGHSVCG